MWSFKHFLEAQGYSEATVKGYVRKQNIFLTWMAREKLTLRQVEYKHLLGLIRYCRSCGHSRATVNNILRVVQLHYTYRWEEGLENPAIGLHIKGSVRRIPHDLFEWEVLISILHAYEVKNPKTQPSKIILGLLIFQAITVQELEKLETTHLKLREGKIEIPGRRRSNRRILPLEASQVLALQEYTELLRPKLLESTRKLRQTNQLFFSPTGGEKLGNTINVLMESLRKAHPENSKITATKIRESVIVHWLKSKDIRMVQYMAGHKYVSSTERYRELDLEHLKEKIQLFHPLQ